MAEDWRIEPLDARRVCQKRRRSLPGSPQPLDTLPAEWRELLTRWVRRGGNSKWDTLRKDAGSNRVQLADDLLNWLLRHRWAHVVEHWEHSAWWPKQVELQQLPQLRAALGLRDRDDEALRWQEIRAGLQSLDNEALLPAVLALDALPPTRALVRHDLILKLHDWQTRHRRGTHRDFALFARGDTKAIGDAEFDWLDGLLDLAEFGIERHTPLLLIAAPLRLHLPHGELDLSACPDFAALTPSTLQAATTVSAEFHHWKLAENRTSFERLAKHRDDGEAVVWLPGYPPQWWLSALGRLLDLAPAPVFIACDPDPAGIAIALQASAPWRERGIAWQPWKMSATDLASLSSRKPLTEADRSLLALLKQDSSLPAMLDGLADWMLEHEEKGEQEGYL